VRMRVIVSALTCDESSPSPPHAPARRPTPPLSRRFLAPSAYPKAWR
jgi:hypothetical protein